MVHRMRDESAWLRGGPRRRLVKAAQTRSAEPLIAGFTSGPSLDPWHRAGSRCRPSSLGLGRPSTRSAAGHAGDRCLVGDRPVRRGTRAPGDPGEPSLAGQGRAVSATEAAAPAPAAELRSTRPPHVGTGVDGCAPAAPRSRLSAAGCPHPGRIAGPGRPADRPRGRHRGVPPVGGARSAVEALAIGGVTAPFHAGNAFLSAPARRGVPGIYLGTNLAKAADPWSGTSPRPRS